MDRTLILVKPDAFARNLTGEIIARFERKGLTLAALRLTTLDEPMAKLHYAEHEGKPFFDGLLTFITSGPVVAMILEGPNAVEGARQLIGLTDGVQAAPGSIRGDYALEMQRNLVHGSDSSESAEREIAIYFGDGV
jgi:nucleoside-diphosphate kinase